VPVNRINADAMPELLQPASPRHAFITLDRA
jgi:hypothetical protein